MAAECSSKSHCYILKKTTQGEKDVTAGLNSDNSNDNGYHKILSLMGIERTNVEVSRGEFVKPVPTANTPYTQAHKYHIMRDPTISFSCPQSNVAALTLQEYEFLNRSEVVPERRFTLYEYILKEPELLEASKRYNVSQPPPRKRPASFAPKVGSTVVVSDYGPYASSYYGVLRWIGQFDGQEEQMAGIELEKDLKGCSDGVTKRGVRYFRCPPGRAMFYSYQGLLPDDRERAEQPDTSERSLSPLEDTYVDEKEQSRQKHLAEKAKAEEERQEATDGDKKSKQMEHEKKEQFKAKQEQQAKLKAKEKALDGDPNHEDIAALRQQVKKLSLQLEQEKRRKQELEMELAFERKKSLDFKRESGASSPNQGIQLASLKGGMADDWQIKRNDVMRTRTLGGGAWGLVYEGWYNDHAVAIKEPHLAIMSEDTNKRMEREINIMALVQHPNLVRFIGAVMDEDSRALKLPPLLVTELMDIDLRSAYQKHDLGSSKLSIFRDVAYALHYLHEHQEPIIHRDVSAPNVLLEALPNDMWRAKLTDFGSANIAKFSKTAAEGAIIYSAPETFPSLDPRRPLPKQTTKIDTFSYGILVCEVITCEQPSPETRHRIIAGVRESWRAMYDLVVECVRERAEARLTMAQVLKELNSIPNNKTRYGRDM